MNPNLDVAYLEAWLAVDPDHAVMMNVPPVEGRYYTVQILDGWGAHESSAGGENQEKEFQRGVVLPCSDAAPGRPPRR